MSPWSTDISVENSPLGSILLVFRRSVILNSNCSFVSKFSYFTIGVFSLDALNFIISPSLSGPVKVSKRNELLFPTISAWSVLSKCKYSVVMIFAFVKTILPCHSFVYESGRACLRKLPHFTVRL